MRDPEDPRPLGVLEAVWDRLPEGRRQEALRTIVTHRPGAAVSRRLLERALRSPLYGERGDALELIREGGDAAALEVLLDAMDDAGPVVAEALLTCFLDAAQELNKADGEQAGILLARHLERWCDAGQLPALDSDALYSWTWPRVTGSPELANALDRCIQFDDPSSLRPVLALLRSELDRDRWPEDVAVGAAMERLYSLTATPEDLPSLFAGSLLDVYADRETVEPAAIHAVLRRAARPTRTRDLLDYEERAGGPPPADRGGARARAGAPRHRNLQCHGDGAHGPRGGRPAGRAPSRASGRSRHASCPRGAARSNRSSG